MAHINPEVYDDPMPDVVFSGKKFVLTGNFVTASRSKVREGIERRGGVVQGQTYPGTDYVLVGTLGSEEWLGDGYGSKIEHALQLKARGGGPAIISEAHIIKYLHDADPQVREKHPETSDEERERMLFEISRLCLGDFGIKGMGAHRVDAIVAHFESFDYFLAVDSPKELLRVTGIGPAQAEKIYHRLEFTRAVWRTDLKALRAFLAAAPPKDDEPPP